MTVHSTAGRKRLHQVKIFIQHSIRLNLEVGLFMWLKYSFLLTLSTLCFSKRWAHWSPSTVDCWPSLEYLIYPWTRSKVISLTVCSTTMGMRGLLHTELWWKDLLCFSVKPPMCNALWEHMQRAHDGLDTACFQWRKINSRECNSLATGKNSK